MNPWIAQVPRFLASLVIGLVFGLLLDWATDAPHWAVIATSLLAMNTVYWGREPGA